MDEIKFILEWASKQNPLVLIIAIIFLMERPSIKKILGFIMKYTRNGTGKTEYDGTERRADNQGLCEILKRNGDVLERIEKDLKEMLTERTKHELLTEQIHDKVVNG